MAMLVLSRKPGEKIVLGSDVTVTVVEIKGNQVRIGIEAPSEVRILRAELIDALPKPTAVRNASEPIPVPGETPPRKPR
jgi:carbon storage regulator